MANTISTPSWREDQPWSIEQGLANTLATRPSNLAETMLTRYGIERDTNQANYHDYMRAINALQQQNITDARHEVDTKNLLELYKNPNPGAIAAARANGQGMFIGLPDDTSQLDTSVQNAATSKNFGEVAGGFGKAGDAGFMFTPQDIRTMMPMAPGTTQGENPRITAQRVANEGRIGAAQVGAGNKYGVTIHANDPATPDNPGGSASGRQMLGETYEQTQKRLLNKERPRTLGENGARDVGNLLPPSKRDVPVTNVPPNLQGPIPGTQPQSRAASPTPAQAQETANRTVAQWHQSVGNPELKQRAREVYEFSVANGKGGVPMLSPELHNGRPAVLGRGGTAYTLQ